MWKSMVIGQLEGIISTFTWEWYVNGEEELQKLEKNNVHVLQNGLT